MILAPFRVVLDACVLYPFGVRDVLLQAAASDFYQPYWSETIMEEVMRNLVADRRMPLEKSAVLAATMNHAFPAAMVTEYEDLIPAMKNHPKDRHVAAAAVKIGAQVIVTENGRDFRDLPSTIEAQTPDQFLSTLFERHPRRMITVLERISQRREKPPMNVAALVSRLRLPEFNVLVTTHLSCHSP